MCGSSCPALNNIPGFQRVFFSPDGSDKSIPQSGPSCACYQLFPSNLSFTLSCLHELWPLLIQRPQVTSSHTSGCSLLPQYLLLRRNRVSQTSWIVRKSNILSSSYELLRVLWTECTCLPESHMLESYPTAFWHTVVRPWEVVRSWGCRPHDKRSIPCLTHHKRTRRWWHTSYDKGPL